MILDLPDVRDTVCGRELIEEGRREGFREGFREGMMLIFIQFAETLSDSVPREDVELIKRLDREVFVRFLNEKDSIKSGDEFHVWLQEHAP